MARSRASAKQAGSKMERLVADHAMRVLDNDAIDRRVKTGNKDRGDIAGLRSAFGERIVAEVKDTARLTLGTWMNEVETEKRNDDAPIGVVIHKRVGFGALRIGGSYVTMTYDDFLRLIGGPDREEGPLL
jgi:hypothetical protein